MVKTPDQTEVDRMAVDQGWERRHGARWAEYDWAYVRGPVRLEIKFGPSGRISKARYSGPNRKAVYAKAPVRALDNEFQDPQRLWELIFQEKMNRIRYLLHAGPQINLKDYQHGMSWSPRAYAIGEVEADPEGGTRVRGRKGAGIGYMRVRESVDEVKLLRHEAIEAYEREITPLVRARAQTEGVGIRS